MFDTARNVCVRMELRDTDDWKQPGGSHTTCRVQCSSLLDGLRAALAVWEDRWAARDELVASVQTAVTYHARSPTFLEEFRVR
jgi:hypothetical protein